MDRRKLYYKGWANVVDFSLEICLANLKTRYGEKRALRELKETLLRKSEAHWQGLLYIFKRLK